MNAKFRRFKCRMNGKRHAQVLGGSKDGIMARVTVWDTGRREGSDKHTFTTIFHSPLKLTSSFSRISQRNMGNRNQPPARVTTKVSKPDQTKPT